MKRNPIIYLALAVIVYFLLRQMNVSGSLDLAIRPQEPSAWDMIMESRTTPALPDAAGRVAGALPAVLLALAAIGATILLLHFGGGFLRQFRLTRGKRRTTASGERNRQQGRGDARPVPATTRRTPQLTDERRAAVLREIERHAPISRELHDRTRQERRS